ncbi:hypothetical protein GK047_07745 [Paenibacillus sp. SYP-B3998]|uniref:Prenylated flavin chaperone LpdD-like domain-containing protein n=1 Tax=Paenibacillus sp. SYP-B3998 TaxID=2678564 RepID=A0A6G3ZW22_9BACL|nr:hypothetical protein [Paenibacillus sp. SYP-B3998]NEW05904.1 hypothetical protein [Paenibacillus sp. SYP-B3998]
MERELSLTIPCTIHIHSYSMGRDRVFLISGGQAHIGAAAVAYPKDHQILCETLTIPGHREGQLAVELAKLAASRLNRTVSVLMGIHVEQATRKDINEIIKNVQHAMRQELERIEALL